MGGVEGIALTDEDRAILALESAAVVGHTCNVVLIGPGAPTAARLRDSVVERLASAPALTRRLGGTAERPAWVDDERFDIAAHVVAADVDPCDDESIRGEVARLFAERLDRSRPLWRIDVLRRAGDGAVLVWRIHHALADGSTAMRFADAVLWDAAPAAGAAAPRPHPAGDDSGRRLRLAAFLRHELTLGHRRSPFDGTIGAERDVAFAGAPLQALHDAARGLAGATVNDAVLTAVAGGLRAWIRDHHGHAGKVRVKVPVSLHQAGDDEGNRDSFFTVELPLDEPDPVARLTAIRAATAARKADHDAETLDLLTHDLARVSPQLERTPPSPLIVNRPITRPRRIVASISSVCRRKSSTPTASTFTSRNFSFPGMPMFSEPSFTGNSAARSPSRIGALRTGSSANRMLPTAPEVSRSRSASVSARRSMPMIPPMPMIVIP